MAAVNDDNISNRWLWLHSSTQSCLLYWAQGSIIDIWSWYNTLPSTQPIVILIQYHNKDSGLQTFPFTDITFHCAEKGKSDILVAYFNPYHDDDESFNKCAFHFWETSVLFFRLIDFHFIAREEQKFHFQKLLGNDFDFFSIFLIRLSTTLGRQVGNIWIHFLIA